MLDGLAIDLERLSAGSGEHPRAAREGETARPAHDSNGVSITRRSGTR